MILNPCISILQIFSAILCCLVTLLVFFAPKFLILMKSNLSNFLLVVFLALCLRNHCLIQGHENLCLGFFLSRVLALTFMLPIFVIWRQVRVQLHSLAWRYSVVHYHCLKRLLFAH